MDGLSVLNDILQNKPLSLTLIVLSKPVKSCAYKKIRVCRADSGDQNGAPLFRAESFTQTQSFTQTYSAPTLAAHITELFPGSFHTALLETAECTFTFLANKKGKVTVLKKAKTAVSQSANAFGGSVGNTMEEYSHGRSVQFPNGCAQGATCSDSLNLSTGFGCCTANPHNRTKNYLLQEGVPVPFLVKLGVMTERGKVVAQKYDKFRQINRFLEYIDDILPQILAAKTAPAASALPKNASAKCNAPSTSTSPISEPVSASASQSPAPDTISVIDFGCGKSYLTFAVYHYLTVIKGLTARIIGLDLKTDVIAHCNALATECGYTNLVFQTGDIADYNADGTFGSTVDLVMTLHACDTATDYALAKALTRNARAILSVPCCQHELNAQLSRAAVGDEFSLLLKYGIIKERFASLVTDVMRADLLRQHGYNVQLLEFIDMTHTPKNVLIRAVRSNKNTAAADTKPNTPFNALKRALGTTLTLETLLMNNTNAQPQTAAAVAADTSPEQVTADTSGAFTESPCSAPSPTHIPDSAPVTESPSAVSTPEFPVKIIALDLDDTLLRDDLTISPYTVSVLQRAVQNGIYVVLCSGRTENAILPYVRQLQIAGSEYGRYMISQNGSTIYDMHARTPIYTRTVPVGLLIDAYKRAISHGLSCEVYDSSTIYSPVLTKWVERDKNLSGLQLQIVEDYAALLRQGFPKMVISGDSSAILRLQDECKAAFNGKATVFTSKPYFLEILPFNTGKGEALQHLAETVLRIPQSHTMGFGDSMNDESMIRYAAHSTAMINGLDAIKAQAAHVTEFSNNDDGVARFVAAHCL